MQTDKKLVVKSNLKVKSKGYLLDRLRERNAANALKIGRLKRQAAILQNTIQSIQSTKNVEMPVCSKMAIGGMVQSSRKHKFLAN